jgi:hypothetical protein
LSLKSLNDQNAQAKVWTIQTAFTNSSVGLESFRLNEWPVVAELIVCGHGCLVSYTRIRTEQEADVNSR